MLARSHLRFGVACAMAYRYTKIGATHRLVGRRSVYPGLPAFAVHPTVCVDHKADQIQDYEGYGIRWLDETRKFEWYV